MCFIFVYDARVEAENWRSPKHGGLVHLGPLLNPALRDLQWYILWMYLEDGLIPGLDLIIL